MIYILHVKKHGSVYCTRWPFSTKGSSRWPSGLSLAAEQGIQVGLRSMESGHCTRCTLWKKNTLKAGKWAFPCYSTKHSSAVKEDGFGVSTSLTCARGACSEWASRLSLATKESIQVGSIGMDVVSQVGLFRIKACSEWASGLSLAVEQRI